MRFAIFGNQHRAAARRLRRISGRALASNAQVTGVDSGQSDEGARQRGPPAAAQTRQSKYLASADVQETSKNAPVHEQVAHRQQRFAGLRVRRRILLGQLAADHRIDHLGARDFAHGVES